jgi:hypothetical protein
MGAAISEGENEPAPIIVEAASTQRLVLLGDVPAAVAQPYCSNRQTRFTSDERPALAHQAEGTFLPAFASRLQPGCSRHCGPPDATLSHGQVFRDW